MRFIMLHVALLTLIVAVGCQRLTSAQAVTIEHGSGVVGTVFGLPPWAGEALGGVIVAIIGAFAGHKHGRACERKKSASGETTVLTKSKG